jgi:hypothetical protein
VNSKSRTTDVDTIKKAVLKHLGVKPKVLISVPNLGEIDRFVVARLFELYDDDRFDSKLAFPSTTPSEACRSHALRQFLAGEFEWWLSIDADNPPAGNPLDLIDYDCDLVGCPTPVWRHNSRDEPTLTWNAYRKHKDGYEPLPMRPGVGMEEVDAIGTGCFLAHRRIFAGDVLERPFQRLWNPDGTVELGSDLAFCERVKAAGFKVHVHWGYPCNHFSTVNLADVMAIVGRARKGEP